MDKTETTAWCVRLEGVERWTREQAEHIYRRFGQDFAPYEYFVFVNYHKASTKSRPMAAYRKNHDVGVFLVATDTSDCRHVLCGFRNEGDRDAFLATSDILIARSKGHHD